MKATNESVLIEASDASIKTATVSVHVIRISNKQMTQAVFNQLPVVSFLDEELYFKPKGKLWGRVNYHNKECELKIGHSHIIFEMNGILYKDAIVHAFPDCYYKWHPSPAYLEFIESAEDAKKMLFHKLIGLGVKFKSASGVRVKLTGSSSIDWIEHRLENGYSLKIAVNDINTSARYFHDRRKKDQEKEKTHFLKECYERALKEMPEQSLSDIEADLTWYIDEYNHLRTGYLEAVEEIKAFPQLFIAV